MTVSELIYKIDEILNLDIPSRLNVSDRTVEQAMEQDSCCKNLLACCNFVADELYSEYALDCRSAVVEAVDGVIDVSGYKISKALSLVDSVGRNVPFKYSSNGLQVARDGKYNLTYARLPRPLVFTSDIELPNSRITERIFIYGVIAEYLRINGDFSQSASWDGRYRQALTSALSAKTTARLPSRRWLL